MGSRDREDARRNMGQTIYLLEDFDPSLDPAAGTFVSLTPQASYQLTRRGIPYGILRDFYDEKELRRGERAYFARQLEWFTEFDSFLKNKIAYCGENGIELARISYNLLKYFVDSLVIQSFISRAVVAKTQGVSVVYVKSSRPAWNSIDDFLYGEKGTFFSRLIPAMMPQETAHRFTLRKTSPSPVPARRVGLDVWAKSAMPHSLKDLFKTGYLRLKYGERSKSFEGSATNVLFVHSGSAHLDPVIKEFLKQGADVFCRSGRRIARLGRIGQRGIDFQDGAVYPAKETEELKQACEQAASTLGDGGHGLLEWVSRECGLNIEEIALPFFKNFVARTCFDILARSKRYEAFLRRQDIDYIVSHTSADIESKAALIASKKLGVRSIGIQHGCDVFVDLNWMMTDLDPFDYYLATDSLSKKKFEAGVTNGWARPCHVLESPHFLSQVKTRSIPAAPGIKNTHRVPTVLYIPTKLLVHQRHFNCMIYPVTWYFEYQKKLMDFFSRTSGCRFIYKHADARVSYASQSIIPYLLDKGHRNISVKAGRVMDHLGKVDAVIMDRPTTAFYEAVASEKPVLALYPDFIETIIDPEALKTFGSSLQSFSTAEEAFSKIGSFLKDLGQDYCPTLPTHDDRAVSYFTSEAAAVQRQEVPL